MKIIKKKISDKGVKGTVANLLRCYRENGFLYTINKLKQISISNEISTSNSYSNYSINDAPQIEDELQKKIRIIQQESDYYYQKLQNLKNNQHLNNKIYKSLNQINESNGSAYFKKSNFSVATVTDEFSFNSFKDTVNLIYINGEENFNVDEFIKINGPIDFFIYITGWIGMCNNDWSGMTQNGHAKNKKLLKIIDEFNKKGIKTIFYSIEDPSDYETYLNIAKRCNYIFTTAVEKIEHYKSDTKNKNCHLLEFAANPLIHNPISLKKNISNNLFFAGSFMRGKFHERTEFLTDFFTKCILKEIPFTIVDRNYLGASLWKESGEMYRFPSNIEPFILPEMEYMDLLKAHKLYKWCVNANSIVSSDSMMAMRVFEMQACGRSLVSNYAPSVSNKFPNVFIYNHHIDFSFIYDKFNGQELYRHQLVGIRNVLSGNTYFDRMQQIFDTLKISKYKDSNRVLVILESSDYLGDFEKQTFKNKDFVFLNDLPNFEIVGYKYFTFFGERNQYGPHYLEDQINCFKFTNVDFITKNSFINPSGIKHNGIEMDYTNEFYSKFLTIFRFDNLKSVKQICNDNFDFKSIANYGFSSDPFGINEGKGIIKKRSKFTLTVIIPIYNNGEFFRDRLFPSLFVSKYFNKMEILLIDDGSTKESTKNILKDFSNRYANMYAHFLQTPASGSASRPRNHGIKIARANNICFIDPDDAINTVNFDYSFEYHLNSDNQATFTALYMQKGNWIWDTHGMYKGIKGDILEATNFQPRNITCSFIKRKVITTNELNFIENAFGEDTLFGYQLLDCLTKFEILPFVCLIYFDDRISSANNSISKQYFEKHAKGFHATLDYFDKSNRSWKFVHTCGKSIFKQFLFDLFSENKEHSQEIISPILDRIIQLNLPDNTKNEFLEYQKQIS